MCQIYKFQIKIMCQIHNLVKLTHQNQEHITCIWTQTFSFETHPLIHVHKPRKEALVESEIVDH